MKKNPKSHRFKRKAKEKQPVKVNSFIKNSEGTIEKVSEEAAP